MATYDARPSGFTNLTQTSEWESLLSAAGVWDGIDGTGSLIPGIDSSGRTANVGAGSCIIKGQLWSTDATYHLNIPAASSQDRIDRVVMRLDRGASSSSAVVSPQLIAGSPSGTPAIPPLQQTSAGIYDIPVCHWTSHANGNLDTLVDDRQFAGRTAVNMTSKYHPSPANPRLGIETDTNSPFLWDGSKWNYLANVLGFDTGPQGDISGWSNQSSITFNLSVPSIVIIYSYLVGQQISGGPNLVHVNSLQIDGTSYDVARDRQVPNGENSSPVGSVPWSFSAGSHTVIQRAYCDPGVGAWRLHSAQMAIIAHAQS